MLRSLLLFTLETHGALAARKSPRYEALG